MRRSDCRRDTRLRQICDNRRQSLATESEKEREARLQQMRDRLASETEEERAARLQQMSVNQCHRLATETEERAARLQQMSAKFVYVLQHAYTEAGLSFHGLKNKDRAVAEVLCLATKEADLDVHLAIFDRHDS